VKRSVYNLLVVKREGKRPRGRHRRRWEDKIKMYLHDVGMWGRRLDQPGSGYAQLAGTCEYPDERSGTVKSRKILDQLLNV
jgi:hypothetical protein